MTILYLLASILGLVLLITRLKLHPFFALIFVSIAFGLFAGMPLPDIITSIQEGFGGTLGKIGLIIVLGVVIGAFLENTGGAMALADWVLRLIGKKRVITGMGIIGYIISIPVFADSGFILLAALNKSLTKKAGLSLAGTAIALAFGLIITHNLVPPTPGPIAAAGILEADLGLVLGFGFCISALTLLVGLVYARRYAARFYIDPSEVTTGEVVEKKHSPGVLKASFPIVIPIGLIIMKSFSGFLPEAGGLQALKPILAFIGEPVIALIIGFLLSLLLPEKLEKSMLSTDGWVGKALRDSAGILLITGAGGIFGKMLQNSGIVATLGDTLSTMNMGIFLPFLIAAALKSAQGSSTVALITTASIVYPLMATLGFESAIDKALVVSAIGAGAMLVIHANDSFFWVVTQMSGMDVKTGYKYLSLGSVVIGLSAMVFTFVFYALLH